MHKRTKALAINPKIKKKVYERDNGRCIICGRYGSPDAHYIARSQSGLGIEHNIVTLCFNCQREYDHSVKRAIYREQIKQYLDEKYPGFPDEERVYNKWREYRHDNKSDTDRSV